MNFNGCVAVPRPNFLISKSEKKFYGKDDVSSQKRNFYLGHSSWCKFCENVERQCDVV